MNKPLKAKAIAVALMLGACSSGGGLDIRPLATGFAQGERPASFRVAEAQAHFALGNVGLAAEGFRRALREEPGSVDALNGLAACYDRMGRFDLARSHYEQALALAPNDPRLYANLATSLDLQGRTGEAATLRKEAATRFASATSGLPLSPAQAPPALASASAPLPGASAGTSPAPHAVPATSVTIALTKVQAPAAQAEVARIGPRLERIGLGEVALRSAVAPSWTPLRQAAAAMSSRQAAARQLASPRPAQVLVLNGTSRSGLAARTRKRLQSSGWSAVAIGDSAGPLRVSQILYPASRTREARRLSQELGLPLRQRDRDADRLVIHLGRDRLKGRARA